MMAKINKKEANGISSVNCHGLCNRLVMGIAKETAMTIRLVSLSGAITVFNVPSRTFCADSNLNNGIQTVHQVNYPVITHHAI